MLRVAWVVVVVGCREPAPAGLSHSAPPRPVVSETLATNLDARALAVDGHAVYVSVERKLVRVGDGHVYPVDYELTDMTIVDGTLYAIADDFHIVSVPLAGGEPTLVADVRGFASALGADRRGAVWGTSIPNDERAGTLVAASHGGAPTVLATGIRFAESIAVDGDFAYWISGDGVFQIPRTGGSPTRLLAPGEHSGNHYLEAHAGKLYASSPDALSVIDEHGAPALVMFRANEDRGPEKLVVDDSGVYFFVHVYGGDWSLHHIPRGGGPDAVLATGLGNPVDIAADADAVYWLDFRAKTLVRRPK